MALLSLLVVAPVNKAKAQPGATISVQTFYNELDPYGQWVDDPDYGYVWIPDAGPGFRPYYTRGHWVMTRYGSMWVSDYSWGWAPFHYGRWAYSSYYGWVWIPDTEWGPAWVSWRSSDDYYGWAPLGPGISISFSLGWQYRVPNDWWVFVPSRYCYSPSFYNYRIAPSRNVTYVNNTTIINNTYVNNNVRYAAGPRVADVERVTKSKVPVYNVATASRPGKTALQGNEVRAYQPQVTKGGGATKPMPRTVVSRDQFIKNKGRRIEATPNDGQNQNNNVNQQKNQTDQGVPPIRNNSPIKQQVDRKQPTQQQMERKQPPQQQMERKQPPTQVDRRQMPQQKQQQQPPPQQVERKQMPQQKQQQQPPSQQVERKQMPQQKQQQQPPPQQMERRQPPQQKQQQQPPPQQVERRPVQQQQPPPQQQSGPPKKGHN